MHVYFGLCCLALSGASVGASIIYFTREPCPPPVVVAAPEPCRDEASLLTGERGYLTHAVCKFPTARATIQGEMMLCTCPVADAGAP